MTVHELICEDGDRKFSVGKSKIVWDGVYVNKVGGYSIHRLIDVYLNGYRIGSEYRYRTVDGDLNINLK